MSHHDPTYEFLYSNYAWPQEGTERSCPFSDIPLHLNQQRPGFNGKPWTCMQCMWYFSEEDLKNAAAYKGQDCPYTLSQKQEQAAASD